MNNNFHNIDKFVKKLGTDTITYVPAKLIPGIINITSVAIFTRIFNPEDYGQYILVLTTTIFLTFLFSQWITQSTLRYRASYVANQQRKRFTKNVFLLLILMSIVLSVLTTLIYPLKYISAKYQRFYIVATLLVIIGVWFHNLVAIYQADLNAKVFSWMTVFNAILKFGLALVFIFFIQRHVESILWATFIAFVLSSLIMSFHLLSKMQQVDKTSRVLTKKSEYSFPLFFKQFFLYGFPMTGWFLGAQLLNIADRYLLQIFRSSSEVGIYSSNYNLVASAILFVSMPLLTAAHPLLMKAGTAVKERKNEVQRLIAIFSRYFLLVAIPIAFYVAFQATALANVFLGSQFREGSIILPIVLVGLLAWYFAMFGHKGLEFREKTNIMFLFVMICTVAKILLNILFIPKYGYIAAAITTLVAFLLYPILVYYGTKPDIRWIIPWISILRISLICLVANGLFRFIHRIVNSPIVLLLITGLTMIFLYPLGLYLSGEFKQYEINYIRKFIASLFNKTTQ